MTKAVRELVSSLSQVGELCVTGPGLCSGYLHGSEASRDAFLFRKGGGCTESAADGLEVERFYRTGDLATRLPDGNYVWVGRKDRQVSRATSF